MSPLGILEERTPSSTSIFLSAHWTKPTQPRRSQKPSSPSFLSCIAAPNCRLRWLRWGIEDSGESSASVSSLTCQNCGVLVRTSSWVCSTYCVSSTHPGSSAVFQIQIWRLSPFYVLRLQLSSLHNRKTREMSGGNEYFRYILCGATKLFVS